MTSYFTIRVSLRWQWARHRSWLVKWWWSDDQIWILRLHIYLICLPVMGFKVNSRLLVFKVPLVHHGRLGFVASKWNCFMHGHRNVFQQWGFIIWRGVLPDCSLLLESKTQAHRSSFSSPGPSSPLTHTLLDSFQTFIHTWKTIHKRPLPFSCIIKLEEKKKRQLCLSILN